MGGHFKYATPRELAEFELESKKLSLRVTEARMRRIKEEYARDPVQVDVDEVYRIGVDYGRKQARVRQLETMLATGE